VYDDNSIIIHNASDKDLNLQQVEFVRGAPSADRDDYSGDRLSAGGFPNDVLTAGSCFRIALSGEEVIEREGCINTNADANEVLTNQELFFWRTEPVSQLKFEVRWQNEVITLCDTVRNNEKNQCGFAYPDEGQ
jgi:hypothetical protein